jgi:protein involved in ribonucleotide reduction
MLVYYSSASGNTKRFVEGLESPALRILNSDLPNPEQDYILVMPTFADPYGRGSVPKPVVNFLNIEKNRKHLRGVVGSGNRNFGEMFAIGARVVAKKCQVDMLYSFELSGTQQDAYAVIDLHKQMEQTNESAHHGHFAKSTTRSLFTERAIVHAAARW